MTNFLADPVACAIRLKNESGCSVLAARSEVLSRATRCTRTEEHDGVYWRWGHLYARREERNGKVAIVGGTHGTNPNHVTETAALAPEHANVMSDLLRAAYASAGSSMCGGKTILELLWDELDAIMDRLMSDGEAEDGRDPGRAEGVAYCIAVMQNPYLPNIDAVREQAMERWENATPPEPAPKQQSFAEEAEARAARRRARRARRA